MNQSANSPIPRLALSANLNGIVLEIWQGDILALPADSIVNAANERLDHAGGLALQILENAGPGLKDASTQWIRANGQIRPGKVAVTQGFKLNYKYIIHAVGPKERDSKANREILIGTLFQSFLENNNHGCQSTVVPGLSTGIFQFPKDVSALLHIEAFLMYAGNYVRTAEKFSLTRIAFVLNNQEVADLFMNVVLDKEESFQSVDFIGLHSDFNGSIDMCLCDLCKISYACNFFSVWKCCSKVCDLCFYQNPRVQCINCQSPFSGYPEGYHDSNIYSVCRKCFNFYERLKLHEC